MNTSSSEAPEFLTPDELATRWRITRRTLDNHRKEGNAPPSIKRGIKRLFRMADVLEFEEKLLKQQGN